MLHPEIFLIAGDEVMLMGVVLFLCCTATIGLLDECNCCKAFLDTQGLSAGRLGVVCSAILVGDLTGSRRLGTGSTHYCNWSRTRASPPCHCHRPHGQWRRCTPPHHAVHVRSSAHPWVCLPKYPPACISGCQTFSYVYRRRAWVQALQWFEICARGR
jgi:hypothetical protein